MGAAYWISALWVLALLMTHYVAYQMLLRPDLAFATQPAKRNGFQRLRLWREVQEA